MRIKSDWGMWIGQKRGQKLDVINGWPLITIDTLTDLVYSETIMYSKPAIGHFMHILKICWRRSIFEKDTKFELSLMKQRF